MFHFGIGGGGEGYNYQQEYQDQNQNHLLESSSQNQNRESESKPPLENNHAVGDALASLSIDNIRHPPATSPGAVLINSGKKSRYGGQNSLGSSLIVMNQLYSPSDKGTILEFECLNSYFVWFGLHRLNSILSSLVYQNQFPNSDSIKVITTILIPHHPVDLCQLMHQK